MITNPGGLRRHLTRRRNALMQTERRMESHWRELRDYIQPFRGRFAGEVADQSAPDLRSILSSEAIRARRTLSAGLQSGLTSPSRQWFKLSIHDPDLAEEQAVTEWCDEVRRRMMIIMSGSSFYHALHSLYDEIAVFGTGAMIIMPDYDHVIRCKTMTVGTYYLGKTNGSAIDTLYRDFYLTCRSTTSDRKSVV